MTGQLINNPYWHDLTDRRPNGLGMRISERFIDDAVILVLDGRMTVDRPGDPLVCNVSRLFGIRFRYRVLDLFKI